MGYLTGLLKYIVKTPLTVVGFVSMYIFGGSIFSVFSGLTHLFTERSVMEAILVYFVTEYLPPTSIEGVIGQVIAGTVVAGLLWFWNTAL
jgi:predicted DNA repair protein MutK